MRRTLITFGLALAAIGLAMISPGRSATIDVASAATACAPFTIDWYTIDSGGLVAATPASGYGLSGTIGQFDVGVHSGGQYTLRDGFWGGIDPRFLGALPIVQR